jgi:hypothetical protein
MTIDWTIKITDLATLVAVLAGPLIAIQVTELLRSRQEARNRKMALFRTLMSTRASTLAPSHVEALNLLDIEFDSKNPAEKRIVDAWKLYHSHLGDQSYPVDAWNRRLAELLVDMLHEMAIYLGYPFDKAHIKDSSYYPRGYGEIEQEQHQLRKAALSLLSNKHGLIVHPVDQPYGPATDGP